MISSKTSNAMRVFPLNLEPLQHHISEAKQHVPVEMAAALDVIAAVEAASADAEAAASELASHVSGEDTDISARIELAKSSAEQLAGAVTQAKDALVAAAGAAKKSVDDGDVVSAIKHIASLLAVAGLVSTRMVRAAGVMKKHVATSAAASAAGASAATTGVEAVGAVLARLYGMREELALAVVSEAKQHVPVEMAAALDAIATVQEVSQNVKQMLFAESESPGQMLEKQLTLLVESATLLVKELTEVESKASEENAAATGGSCSRDTLRIFVVGFVAMQIVKTFKEVRSQIQLVKKIGVRAATETLSKVKQKVVSILANYLREVCLSVRKDHPLLLKLRQQRIKIIKLLVQQTSIPAFDLNCAFTDYKKNPSCGNLTQNEFDGIQVAGSAKSTLETKGSAGDDNNDDDNDIDVYAQVQLSYNLWVSLFHEVAALSGSLTDSSALSSARGAASFASSLNGVLQLVLRGTAGELMGWYEMLRSNCNDDGAITIKDAAHEIYFLMVHQLTDALIRDSKKDERKLAKKLKKMEEGSGSIELEFKRENPKLPTNVSQQAARCKKQLVRHSAAKAAQLESALAEVLGRIELFIGFLQISGTIFTLDVNIRWPSAWKMYYSYFLSLFSLQINFAATLPFDFDFSIWNQWFKAPLVLVVIVLLYFASERLWLNGHEWKVAYLDQWPTTRKDSLLRWMFLNVVVAFTCVLLFASEVLSGPIATGVFATFWAFSTCGYAVWYMVAKSAKVLYQLTADTDVEYDFFHNIRSTMRSLAIFIFLIGFLPMARSVFEALRQYADGEANLVSLLLATVTSIALLGSGVRLAFIVRGEVNTHTAKTSAKTPAEYWSRNPNATADQAAPSVLDVEESSATVALYYSRKRKQATFDSGSWGWFGGWSKSKTKEETALEGGSKADARRRSQKQQQSRLNGNKTSLQVEVAKQRNQGWMVFTREHGAPYDKLWKKFESKFVWWKFLTILERAALVAIATFGQPAVNEANSPASASIASLITVGLLLVTLVLQAVFMPYVNLRDDVQDGVGRLVNFANALIGVVLAEGWLGESTETAAAVVLITINSAAVSHAVYTIDPVAFVRVVFGKFASIRMKIAEKKERAAKKRKESAKAACSLAIAGNQVGFRHLLATEEIAWDRKSLESDFPSATHAEYYGGLSAFETIVAVGDPSLLTAVLMVPASSVEEGSGYDSEVELRNIAIRSGAHRCLKVLEQMGLIERNGHIEDALDADGEGMLFGCLLGDPRSEGMTKNMSRVLRVCAKGRAEDLHATFEKTGPLVLLDQKNLTDLLLRASNIDGLQELAVVCKWEKLDFSKLGAVLQASTLERVLADRALSVNLVDLDCAETELTGLPELRKHFKALTSLNLGSCKKLERLPDSLGECKALTSLNLELCLSLTTVPNTIGDCSSLTSLDISCTGITSLPELLGECKALTSLNLESCYTLKSLPETLGEWKALTRLNLRSCEKLETYPLTIGVLKARGCNVDTAFCPAATLSGDIATVKDETQLDFSSLPITGLHDSLGECKALTSLNLERCEKLENRWYCEDGSSRTNLLPGQNPWDDPIESGHFQDDICQHCNNDRKDHKLVPGLPESLGECKALTSLNLERCEKLKIDEEQLKAQLPNCEIKF